MIGVKNEILTELREAIVLGCMYVLCNQIFLKMLNIYVKYTYMYLNITFQRYHFLIPFCTSENI